MSGSKRPPAAGPSRTIKPFGETDSLREFYKHCESTTLLHLLRGARSVLGKGGDAISDLRTRLMMLARFYPAGQLPKDIPDGFIPCKGTQYAAAWWWLVGLAFDRAGSGQGARQAWERALEQELGDAYTAACTVGLEHLRILEQLEAEADQAAQAARQSEREAAVASQRVAEQAAGAPGSGVPQVS